jgi:hypothetical protein
VETGKDTFNLEPISTDTEILGNKQTNNPKTLYLIVREEHRTRVCTSKLLKICGTKEDGITK